MHDNFVEANTARLDLTDPYSTGILNKDMPTEFLRLQALERWSDPTTMALVEKFGIPPDARCLEMGAGAGSMAYWFAEQCPRGHVVAADIDPRYLDARRAPNLEVARVDLTRHDFPAASFDWIHTRFVLSHIPERDDILRRAISWLKPGGAILVEDYYVLSLEHIHREEIKAVFSALARTFVTQGSDIHWGRRIPNKLAELGIRDLAMTMTPITFGLPGPCEDLWTVAVEQFFSYMLEKQSLTAEQAAAYRALSTSGMPDAIDVPWVLFSVAGRKR
ncbi:methyltransferase domain-containing protein [Pendulispora rubella]|uniref:Methyltransferase domain-containing protein n=1 Tax=Pendulispora rubella TaxID=2741070 RepID=A0ABZ2KX97_9BACT